MAFEHLITKAGQRPKKAIQMARWYIYFSSERNISIENERISRTETEICTLTCKKKKKHGHFFFISEELQQKLMKFCQKSKSKDVAAASGHLLCKFFQTIFTGMSERDPQKRWVWSRHNEKEEFIQPKLFSTSLFRRQSKCFHPRFSETINF